MGSLSPILNLLLSSAMWDLTDVVNEGESVVFNWILIVLRQLKKVLCLAVWLLYLFATMSISALTLILVGCQIFKILYQRSVTVGFSTANLNTLAMVIRVLVVDLCFFIAFCIDVIWHTCLCVLFDSPFIWIFTIFLFIEAIWTLLFLVFRRSYERSSFKFILEILLLLFGFSHFYRSNYYSLLFLLSPA